MYLFHTNAAVYCIVLYSILEYQQLRQIRVLGPFLLENVNHILANSDSSHKKKNIS